MKYLSLLLLLAASCSSESFGEFDGPETDQMEPQTVDSPLEEMPNSPPPDGSSTPAEDDDNPSDPEETPAAAGSPATMGSGGGDESPATMGSGGGDGSPATMGSGGGGAGGADVSAGGSTEPVEPDPPVPYEYDPNDFLEGVPPLLDYWDADAERKPLINWKQLKPECSSGSFLGDSVNAVVFSDTKGYLYIGLEQKAHYLCTSAADFAIVSQGGCPATANSHFGPPFVGIGAPLGKRVPIDNMNKYGIWLYLFPSDANSFTKPIMGIKFTAFDLQNCTVTLFDPSNPKSTISFKTVAVR